MNELHPRARLALELARTDSEPSSADKLRIYQALQARLGAPPIMPPMQDGAATGSITQAGAAALARSSAPLARWIGVSVIAAALGFGAGFMLRGPASSTPAPVVIATSLSASVPPITRATEAAPVSDVGAASVSDVGAAPVRATSLAARAAKGRSTAQRRVVASGSNEPDLLEALNLLRRAQRALRKQEPKLALALLGELDRGFAPNVLLEERQATRVLALCADGDTERARQTANELLSGNPHSIYAARLRESCADLSRHSTTAPPKPRQ